MVMTYCLGVGASIGFYQGSPLKLLDDIAALRPTVFPSVPRLLNRIYDKVIAAVEQKGGISYMVKFSFFHFSFSLPSVLFLFFNTSQILKELIKKKKKKKKKKAF